MNRNFGNTKNLYLSKLNKICSTIVKNNFSYALWSLPGKRKVQKLFGKSSLISIDKIQDNSFIICPFENSEKVFAIEKNNSIDENISIDENLNNIHISKSNNQGISKNEYLTLVENGIQEIRKGGFQKLVLSRNYLHSISEKFNPLDFFYNIQNKYIDAFTYLISVPELGTWIGASPELFLKRNKKHTETVALAGTKTKDEIQKNILFSEKEKKEQEIVSEYIRDVLKELNINFVEHKAEIIKAAELCHLQSRFVTQNNDFNLSKLIINLHPTPAVCGTPKKEAFKYIVQKEGYKRELYSGFIGPYFNKYSFEYFVNLRCMQVHKSKAIFYAGAGILSDSCAEDEYFETQNKIRTLLSTIEKKNY